MSNTVDEPLKTLKKLLKEKTHEKALAFVIGLNGDGERLRPLVLARYAPTFTKAGRVSMLTELCSKLGLEPRALDYRRLRTVKPFPAGEMLPFVLLEQSMAKLGVPEAVRRVTMYERHFREHQAEVSRRQSKR